MHIWIIVENGIHYLLKQNQVMFRNSSLSFSFLIFTLLLISCQDESIIESNDPIFKAIDSLNQTSRFSFDVPLDRYGLPDLSYRESMSADSILNIPRYNAAEDDLFLKIGADFDGSRSRQHLILQLQKGKWRVKSISISKDKKNDPPSFIQHINSLQPKHGWKYLTENLLRLNLLFIPTMDKLNYFGLLVAHSEINCFSIDTKNSHRYYYYYGEETLTRVGNVNCKNTLAIIQLLRREFYDK